VFAWFEDVLSTNSRILSNSLVQIYNYQLHFDINYPINQS